MNTNTTSTQPTAEEILAAYRAALQMADEARGITKPKG